MSISTGHLQLLSVSLAIVVQQIGLGSKYEIKKFTGTNDLGLWNVEMNAILVRDGLAIALDGVENLPARTSR